MSQKKYITGLLIPVCCALILALNPAWAGDEDMMNPYQKFDPETGFFIDDPSKSRQHQTPAEKQDPGQDQAAGRTPTEQTGTGEGSSPATPMPSSPVTGTPTLVAGSLLMLGLVVGGFFWLRRDTRKTS